MVGEASCQRRGHGLSRRRRRLLLVFQDLILLITGQGQAGADQQVADRHAAEDLRRRLVDALRTTRASSGGAPQPRAVKAAADSALALTAHGQTRWSRAILLSTCRRRVLVKAGGKIRKRHHRRPTKAPVLEQPPALLKERKVKERLRVLGRLVPGCRKLATPALLEETADYVAALEMQVKTMRALADALAAAQLHDHGEMVD
ncbi:hypothetical protein PR202_gb27298 [Eleusine coracana subsp. coracana]|uniref:BHLH domain-containing protein n=1 Tax=Eleusine coracana subsp. coracana TaxID=191504 RepID=A0AAV5FU41_ELECO|nr:hypothetical protein PR202_gb27298 [Eleusine coracana subsp. coracana]